MWSSEHTQKIKIVPCCKAALKQEQKKVFIVKNDFGSLIFQVIYVTLPSGKEMCYCHFQQKKPLFPTIYKKRKKEKLRFFCDFVHSVPIYYLLPVFLTCATQI